MALITLTTDFGLRDPWVGSMKGVILSICPEARLVDLTHDIPPHAVTAGCYVLDRCLPYYPKGSIHLVVIDPGVGSARRPLVGSFDGSFVVGPDNGLFGDLYDRSPGSECFEITASDYLLAPPSGSPTFQGRDVFAPVAAHLARGVRPSAFGPRVADPVRLAPRARPSQDRGEVVWIDRFGNLITNLRPGGSVEYQAVALMGREVSVVRYYQQAVGEQPAALVNSDQCIEIFVNRGDAAKILGATIGTPVELVQGTKPSA